jgi:hypothetical protein
LCPAAVGRLQLQSMRNYTQNALAAGGERFDPLEFNMILTKFGGSTLETLDALVHTYVALKTDAPDVSEMFGYELIQNMFSATLPVIGLGRKS